MDDFFELICGCRVPCLACGPLCSISFVVRVAVRLPLSSVVHYLCVMRLRVCFVNRILPPAVPVNGPYSG